MSDRYDSLSKVNESDFYQSENEIHESGNKGNAPFFGLSKG